MPDTSCPNTTCLPLRWGVAFNVTKNCDPLESFPGGEDGLCTGWSKACFSLFWKKGKTSTTKTLKRFDVFFLKKELHVNCGTICKKKTSFNLDYPKMDIECPLPPNQNADRSRNIAEQGENTYKKGINVWFFWNKARCVCLKKNGNQRNLGNLDKIKAKCIFHQWGHMPELAIDKMPRLPWVCRKFSSGKAPP